LLAIFLLFTVNSYSLSYSALGIHGDAPALAFAACACLALIMNKSERISSSRLFISALCAICAIWTKQVFLPIIFAIPTYFYLSGQKNASKKHFYFMVTIGLMSLATFFFINFRDFFYSAITVPRFHPWKMESHFLSLLDGIVGVFEQSLMYVVIILVVFLLNQSKPPVMQIKNISDWLRSNSWSIFLVVAFFMLPMTLLGWVKIGGDYNSFSYIIYFLVIAIVFGLSQLFNENVAAPVVKNTRIFLIILMVYFVGMRLYDFSQIGTRLFSLAYNDHKQAYEFALKHPQEVYYPNNPLSTLLAEERLYHSAWALFEKEMSGYATKPEHFKKHIPHNLKYVIFPRQSEYNYTYIFKYLPEFSKQIELEEFPGGLVFIRDEE